MDCLNLSPGCNDIELLLVTANVGSLFEDPVRLLRPWITVFLQKVEQIQPKFLALHLQEVGGKTYEKSTEYVQEFIKNLCEATQMLCFEFIRIYIDEAFDFPQHFTALGSLYFVHKSVKHVNIWNFLTNNWESAEGKHIYSGNIETISSKEKSKFPQHFFPECKWSRKGFMRTRWELNNTVFDLINIHLFHDASNLAACEEFPSIYCKTRRRALMYTLERFHLDENNGLAPFFVFGDFNFRCDTEGVIKELTENLTAHRTHSIKNECTKVQYRNSDGDNILTVGKKEFTHADHQLKFKESWLRKYDRELEPLTEFLIEFPINFPPSYPYEEDPEIPADYMFTRCPSWCDRILMSIQAKELIYDTKYPNVYSIMGENVCMGDHKPVYLNIRLKSNQGTYRCCSCYSNTANNNKSTSHHIPAERSSPLGSFTEQENAIKHSKIYCPYASNIYKLENKNMRFLKTNENDKQGNGSVLRDAALENLSKNLNTSRSSHTHPIDETLKSKWPPISINIVDSDNINVCMCLHISTQNKENNDAVNCKICEVCRNLKKQPEEPRYRLISKRLMLSNNIILNRIDTQHLSTYFDISNKLHDPYTPESVESHSPYPEQSTTDCQQLFDAVAHKVCLSQHVFTNFNVDYVKSNEYMKKDVNCNDEIKNQQRGVVSAVQLQSRLQNLQKTSSKQNFKFRGKFDGDGFDTAGNSDVEYVDKICQPTNVAVQRCSNSCLPKCCNIH